MNDAPSPHRDRAQRQIDESLPRNFWALAVNQIAMRIGWVFRTETVIIPGFVDHLGASGALRGLLPMIGRIGASLPQFLLAPALARLPRQKWAYFVSNCLQGLPWVLIAALLLFVPLSPGAMLACFMALYTLSAAGYGLCTLSFGTLQGKLIPPRQRGRLLASFGLVGGTSAIVGAALLVPLFLTDQKADYGPVFALCGGLFVVATFILLGIREPAVRHRDVSAGLRGFVRDSFRVLGQDRNFRLLTWVVTLMYLTLLLFPHYTVFGLRRVGVTPQGFVTLIIAQNSVNAAGSFLFGNLADRRGNRAMLRLMTVVAAAVPLLAVLISRLPASVAPHAYPVVYACLGFTPVSQRIVTNYALEIAPQERHPQYLGILSVMQAFPIFASPLVGWAIDRASFEPVFLCFSGLMFVGALLSVWLVEPREQ